MAVAGAAAESVNAERGGSESMETETATRPAGLEQWESYLQSVPRPVLEQGLEKLEAQVAELEQVIGPRSARKVLLMALVVLRKQVGELAVLQAAVGTGPAFAGPEPSASDT
jgi:hypothetical protein